LKEVGDVKILFVKGEEMVLLEFDESGKNMRKWNSWDIEEL
jgi:hypothetical protein